MNKEKRNDQKNNELIKRCCEIACPLGYHDRKICPYNHNRKCKCYCAYQSMCNNVQCHNSHGNDNKKESYVCPFWVKGYCRLYLYRKCRFIHPSGQDMPEKLTKLRQSLMETKILMKEKTNNKCEKMTIINLPNRQSCDAFVRTQSFAQVCVPRRQVPVPRQQVPAARQQVLSSSKMLTEIAEGRRQFPEDEFWRLDEQTRAIILQFIVTKIGFHDPISDFTMSLLKNHDLCIQYIMERTPETSNEDTSEYTSE